MAKGDFPNKPGNYRIDDVDIYVFPDKIIVDTGNRQTANRPEKQNRTTHEQRKSNGSNEKKPKKDIVNTILDTCEDVVMGRRR